MYTCSVLKKILGVWKGGPAVFAQMTPFCYTEKEAFGFAHTNRIHHNEKNIFVTTIPTNKASMIRVMLNTEILSSYIWTKSSSNMTWFDIYSIKNKIQLYVKINDSIIHQVSK